MNLHHLELFYYVARHGGISEAVRNIPYGIQQPAVSAQILQLEDALGATLFQRRPFALTPAGEKLFTFIQPFFGNLDQVEHEIRGGADHQIRIGASEIVLRDHLPEVLREVRQTFPKLKLVLRRGYQPELETLLQNQEIDVAVTILERKPPPGMRSVSLLRLPLVLLVNKRSKVRSSEELWKRDKIDETLLCLRPSEAICKRFQQGLVHRGVDWYPGIELSSIELIETYVQNGYGIGLSVAIPNGKPSKEVRILPLEGFEPVDFGILYEGKPRPIVTAFVDAMKNRASHLAPQA